jgi:hypothetical protein
MRSGLRHASFANWVRPSLRLVVVLMAGPGLSAAQPAAPPPATLPSVVYPDRDPDTAPSTRGPALAGPAPVAENGEPVTYELVNGVWGYWDRDRHFHPRVAESVRDRRVPWSPTPGFDRTRPIDRVPHMRASLPKSVPSAIVVHSPSPRDRTLPR